jgi:hypothetical protein
MSCRHWRNGCTLGLYGGRPSPGVCRQCPSYRGPWRGAGDAVRALVRILFLGRTDIAERLAGRVEALWRRPREDVSVRLPTTPRRPCGCKGRQQALNRYLPFN